MLRHLSWSLAAVVGLATSAAAQGAAGTWNGKSTIGPRDSVITTYVLTIAADGKSASMTFPNRDPIPTRVVAMAGDSVATEAGPYPSILRPGQTVNLLRTIVHYKGDAMWGAFEAKYANGDVVKGKMAATRAK